MPSPPVSRIAKPASDKFRTPVIDRPILSSECEYIEVFAYSERHIDSVEPTSPTIVMLRMVVVWCWPPPATQPVTVKRLSGATNAPRRA